MNPPRVLPAGLPALVTRPLVVGVCGGTGFVGHALILRLVRAGHAVRVPTRNPGRGDDLLPLSSVELIPGDVYDADFLRRSLEGCDVVVNLVSMLNERGRDGAGFRRVHVQFTAHVLRAMHAVGARRLLLMSALNADAARGRSHYLRTKGEAEQLVRAERELGWTIFRPSVIFGPGDSLTRRFAGLLRLSAGLMPLARANTRFAPIYVDDVAAAFMCALRGGAAEHQVYELCGPDVLTLRQIVELTARAAHLPCHVLALPDLLGRAQGALMDWFPGKPFSSDNFRSLLSDSVCQEDGCARLGIRPSGFGALLSGWLSPATPPPWARSGVS
jgi:NADH dehydrogenase